MTTAHINVTSEWSEERTVLAMTAGLLGMFALSAAAALFPELTASVAGDAAWYLTGNAEIGAGVAAGTGALVGAAIKGAALTGYALLGAATGGLAAVVLAGA